jgi:hypothetical protein
MKTKVVLDATPIDVTVTDDRLIVALADGRELSAPDEPPFPPLLGGSV